MSEDLISRRDFFKIVGVSGTAGLLVGTGLANSAINILEKRKFSNIEPLALTPEIVDGVEVYGLKEKITSASTVDSFYSYLDDQFTKTNNIKIVDKVKQRKELLNPNERYLEVVTRRSAYDSFIRKETETGVSFPEWIKIPVDVMNRSMKNAKPPAEMKADLMRILVIDDNMAKEFWDEKAYREGRGVALDVVWRERFTPTYPINTDQSWAIADDYRDSGGGMFWEVRHENGKTIIGTPPGKVPFDRYYEFPEENDSLSGKNNVSFDSILMHELSHYLLTLPDEYALDVHDASQRFKDFTIGTGSFQWPYFSPYLSYLTRENINLKERGLSPQINKIFYYRPKNIGINVKLDGFHGMRIEIRRVTEKQVLKDADAISSSTSIDLNDDLFQGGSKCWLLRLTNGSESREVFLPAAAFNMSKIAGLESAKYNLIFSGYDDTGRTKQEVMFVDKTDIDEFLKDSQDPPYAKMKVEGTDTWFVWFLRA